MGWLQIESSGFVLRAGQRAYLFHMLVANARWRGTHYNHVLFCLCRCLKFFQNFTNPYVYFTRRDWEAHGLILKIWNSLEIFIIASRNQNVNRNVLLQWLLRALIFVALLLQFSIWKPRGVGMDWDISNHF